LCHAYRPPTEKQCGFSVALPRRHRDFISHFKERESPRGLDTDYTGRPTKKTHGDRVPSGRPVDFESTPGKSANRKGRYYNPLASRVHFHGSLVVHRTMTYS
jgi:hypothetical protein